MTSQTTTAGAPGRCGRARRFDAGERLDLEAGQLQRLGRCQPHVLVVLDEQHADAGCAFTRSRELGTARRCGRDRQVDREAGAARVAGCAPRRRAADGRARCAPRSSGPSPRPGPAGLLVTKGSNRRGRMSARMPGPVSRHGQHDAAAVGARASTRSARCGAACIASIALPHQVDQHLLQRASSASTPRSAGSIAPSTSTPTSRSRAAHERACASAMPRASGTGCERPLALVREDLQLARQPRQAVHQPAMRCRLPRTSSRRLWSSSSRRCRTGAQRRQRLVQLVHHAGRHLAQRGHLAGMHQLALRRAQLRGARDHLDSRLSCAACSAAGWPACWRTARRRCHSVTATSSSTAIARPAVIAA